MAEVKFRIGENHLGFYVSVIGGCEYLLTDGSVNLHHSKKLTYHRTKQLAEQAVAKYNGEYKMKKSDLKTGMIVEMSDGYHRIVLGNSLMGISDCSGGIPLSSVNDDLTLNYGEEIVKVYDELNANKKDYIGAGAGWFERAKIVNILKYTTCIWEREEPKDITVAEIEEILGYKIKVVGE